jgi:hypothetical protein
MKMSTKTYNKKKNKTIFAPLDKIKYEYPLDKLLIFKKIGA